MNNAKFAVTVSDYCTKMEMALKALSRVTEEDDGAWFVAEAAYNLFRQFKEDVKRFQTE